MSSKPKYWDTKKGKVLYAIYKSQGRTRDEIQGLTGFRKFQLRKILGQLINSGEVTKPDNSYWIENYDLYCQYRDYDQTISTKKQKVANSLETLQEQDEPILEYIKNNPSDSIIKDILNWTKNKIKIEPKHEQFFVHMDNLDQVSKAAIEQAREKVIIVNPFVDQCSLSDKLKYACKGGKEITLLTRSPSSENYKRTRVSRRKYHEALQQSGVDLFYNDRIHSKIILADSILGVVSSMNFKSESSSGKNLEAGMVTWQKDVISSLIEYIETISTDPETQKLV